MNKVVKSKIKFKDLDKYGFPVNSHDGYVYIASMGPVSKVGCTRNPQSRIGSLESSAGIKFDKVYFSQAHSGSFKSESQIHEILSSHNICREWFHISPLEIIDLCANIIAVKAIYDFESEF